MNASLAKFLDWSILQILTMRWPGNRTRNLRLGEALEFLKSPEFIPAQSRPADLKFKGRTHFQFATPQPCGFSENNIAHGRLYRCAGQWQKRPAIILLHGGTDFLNHRFRYPLIARHCNRAGFNAATLVAPYHFQRHPPKLESLDYLEWAKATAQAAAEIRALTGWLLTEGCPEITVWGFSMGGWFAGLTACCEPRLSSVVMAMPCVRMNIAMARLVLRRAFPKSIPGQPAEYEALNQTSWNLTSTPPVIPKEKILLVEATHDLLTTKESIEELWHAWGQPEIWRLPHGHVSWMAVPGVTDRVLKWLASTSVHTTRQHQQTRI